MSLETTEVKNGGHRPGGISGIRRNRPSYSCEGCRSRRVKCDLAHPECGSCSRNGMKCLYPNATAKRSSSSSGTARRLSCTKASRRRSSHEPYLAESSTNFDPECALQPRVSFWATLSGMNDCNGNMNVLRILNGTYDINGSSTYHASTDETHPFLSVYERVTVRSVHGSIGIREILQNLPDRSICDQLYTVFMCCVHPITPYFHYPTFDQRYRRFWSHYDQWSDKVLPTSLLAEDTSFLPLFLAVLYYGSIVEPLVLDPVSSFEVDLTTSTSAVTHRSQADSSSLLALGTRALGIVDFPNKTTLSSLAAFMLLQMDQLRCQDTSACSFVAVSIRIAQSMGLHREDVNMAFDAAEAEERRRIWALLVHLDMLTARKSGLSPILNQRTNDFKIPLSEVRDEFIRTSFASDPRHEYPAFVLARGRYEATTCVKPILALQAEGSDVSVSDIDQLAKPVRQLEHNMEQLIARIQSMSIPSILPFSAAGLIAVPSFLWAQFDPDPVAFSKWSETTLRYIVEQAYCDLYSLALADLSVWAELRNEAIPHYQAYLRYYLLLTTTHRYRPHQWLYPGYHQPIQAVAVLLVDLLSNADCRHASESQSLVDMLFRKLHAENFASTGRASRLMPVASDVQRPFAAAWANLDQLRRTVWSKLGLGGDTAWVQMPDFTTQNLPDISVDTESLGELGFRQENSWAASRCPPLPPMVGNGQSINILNPLQPPLTYYNPGLSLVGCVGDYSSTCSQSIDVRMVDWVQDRVIPSEPTWFCQELRQSAC